jgi:hypothetical protein
MRAAVAMLILSVGTGSSCRWAPDPPQPGGSSRPSLETAAGLVAGFVLTSPRVQLAEEAIEELCGTMAGLLDRLATGLRDGPV